MSGACIKDLNIKKYFSDSQEIKICLIFPSLLMSSFF